MPITDLPIWPGLASMRERVKLVNGRLEIETAPGRGTTLVAVITMPHLNGIDALTQMRLRDNPIPVVFLTMHRDASLARRAFEAGASGFVLKQSAPAELVLAIAAAFGGKTYLTQQLAGRCWSR